MVNEDLKNREKENWFLFLQIPQDQMILVVVRLLVFQSQSNQPLIAIEIPDLPSGSLSQHSMDGERGKADLNVYDKQH